MNVEACLNKRLKETEIRGTSGCRAAAKRRDHNVGLAGWFILGGSPSRHCINLRENLQGLLRVRSRSILLTLVSKLRSRFEDDRYMRGLKKEA